MESSYLNGFTKIVLLVIALLVYGCPTQVFHERLVLILK